MKRIIMVMAVLLIGAATSRAGELKVMVPVNDYKQMQSRLQTLEQENNQLRQSVSSGGMRGGSSQETAALQSRLTGLERENNSLRQQLSAQQAQVGGDELAGRIAGLERENDSLRQQLNAQQAQPDSGELTARIATLEQENSQLQKQLAEQPSPQMAVGDSAVEARLAEVENENSQLKQEVKVLKEGTITTALLGDKSSARQKYANARHVQSYHNFKF